MILRCDMDFVGIKERLGADLERVDELIRVSLASDIELLDSTNRSILLHPGKQLRPVLCLLVAKACSGGGTTEDTLLYASATELLHNATLLHDDVADDSPERRGVPTVMSILGGRASVLLGDYWLVKAMENILRSVRHSARVIGIFSGTLADLAEGELLQLQKASSGDTDEEDYFRIIYSKTASLFEAAAVSAAISVEADEPVIEAVRSYSRNLGMAFQIRDDIFDYEENPQTGKPAGLDLLEQKITMPLLCALSEVSEDEAKLIRGKVRDMATHPEHRGEVVRFVCEHGGVGAAAVRLGEYVARAKAALTVLGRGEYVRMLMEIADFVAERKS